MTRPVGDVLKGWLDRAGLAKAAGGAMVVAGWPELAGPAVARHARAEKVERGVLVVRVDSSVWATELSTRIPVLLERIRSRYGEGLVKEIRFVTGRPRQGAGRRGADGPGPGRDDRSGPWPDRHDLASVDLPPEDLEKVRSFSRAIRDEALARAGERWLTATLKARRWLSERGHARPGEG